MKILKRHHIGQHWNIKEKNHPNHRWNCHQDQRFIPPNIGKEKRAL